VASPSSYRPAPGSIPTKPGVYRFRDAKGRVIYVGKAKSLRPRLSSYFQDIGNLHPRTATMVTTGASVEWTVVDTEVEALQLEYSWIKEFDPRFNVKYRDDKSYPWLAVTVGDEFPRVMVGRGAKRKGTRYFGPYSHAWAIRETVDQLLRVFPMRSCSNGVFKRSAQIGRRQRHRRGAPRDRRRLLRLHGRQHDRLHPAHRAGDVRRLRGARLREGRPAA
jgi:excinuclease ABC subunit C